MGGGQQDEQAESWQAGFKGLAGLWKGARTREPKVTERGWRSSAPALGRLWASGGQPGRQGWEPGGA